MRKKGNRTKVKAKRKRINYNVVYFIPSLLTILNLYMGFVSINFAIKGKFQLSGLFIILAAVMDLMDGRTARALRSSTPLGRELDSIADIVSFGVAPSILIYLWALKDFPKLGYFVSFLFLVAGALRLARFNVLAKNGITSKKYFVGLPIPSAAIILTSTVIFFQKPPEWNLFPILLGVIVFLTAFLMISKFKFRSFKDVNLKSKEHYLTLFFFSIALSALAAWPTKTLFFLSYGYAISGPVLAIKEFIKKVEKIEDEKENEQAKQTI
ncbi:MAG: CDP-diacylglycerol--serine O-phosphatidyltransferase [Candidatus Aminicenantes bacterium]|nr:CDP-diacylglycerol--serine O-phosphatidyltransferase [Candidatus Aminicenantes bacterium]